MYYNNNVLEQLLNINIKQIHNDCELFGFEINQIKKDQFSLHIPFNRKDCISLYGLAMEIACWYNIDLNTNIYLNKLQEQLNTSDINHISKYMFNIPIKDKNMELNNSCIDLYISAKNILENNYKIDLNIPYTDYKHRKIEINLQDFNQIIGENMTRSEFINYLEKCKLKLDLYNQVTIPSYKTYLNTPLSVYQDIIRIRGYNKIKPKDPNICFNIPDIKNSLCLSDIGYDEIKSMHLQEKGLNNQIQLINPDKGARYLRSSIIPFLIEKYRDIKNIRIFEKGPCFEFKDNTIISNIKIAGIVNGNIRCLSWYKTDKVNIHYVLGDLEWAHILVRYYTKNIKHTLLNNALAIFNNDDKNIGVIGSIGESIIFETIYNVYNTLSVVKGNIIRDFSISTNLNAGEIVREFDYLINSINSLKTLNIIDYYKIDDKNNSYTIRATITCIQKDCIQVIKNISDKIIEQFKAVLR